MTAIVKKPKKKFTLKDVGPRDLELLFSAAQMPQKAFFCYGPVWFKLISLNLIDEDTRVTLDGVQLLRDSQKKPRLQ